MMHNRGWGLGKLGICCLRVQTQNQQISPGEVKQIIVITDNKYCIIKFQVAKTELCRDK